MAFQTDSLQHSGHSGAADSAVVHHEVLTPAKVISWLPRDATPAQKDSAVQAHFKPAPIRWSRRPDTLHLPGHDRGHNMLETQLPQYYREGFFSQDSLFHPELPGGRSGMAGEPVPYRVHNDDFMTSLLLICFMLLVLALSSVRRFFSRQIRNFFYTSHGVTTETMETATETRFQLFIVMLSCLLIALLFYFYTLHFIGQTFILQSQYNLIFIYQGIIAGYFLLKLLFYTVANLVFFDGKRNEQWIRTQLFITSIEGILLFPAVLVQAYFQLPVRNVIAYFILVLLFVKILSFYKCYVIFFRRNVVSMQIILYLCALEIVPLLCLWSTLDFTANSLKINY